MKIVVTGGHGMLGCDVVSQLRDAGHDVVAPVRGIFDITQKENMDFLSQEKPDSIINCAAYTAVDDAETNREECFRVNVAGVQNLVEYCQGSQCRLVQLSTDYVFDGKQKSYRENNKKNPINYYGETKSAAEDCITKGLSDYQIVRTSWLFGRHGKNFVQTMIALMGQYQKLRIVNDQTGSPTYTRDLAKALVQNVECASGVYHLTNSGICTWYEFATEIAQNIGYTGIVEPCSSEAFPKPAKRPRFSVLQNTKTELLPDWKEALQKYISQK